MRTETVHPDGLTEIMVDPYRHKAIISNVGNVEILILGENPSESGFVLMEGEKIEVSFKLHSRQEGHPIRYQTKFHLYGKVHGEYGLTPVVQILWTN